MSSLSSLTTQLTAAQDYAASVLQPTLTEAEAQVTALEAQLEAAHAARSRAATELTCVTQRITELQARVNTLNPSTIASLPATHNTVYWHNESFAAISLREQQEITSRIDNNTFESSTESIKKAGTWHTKHHPTAEFPAKILKAIREYEYEYMSFQNLLTAVNMSTKGEHSLQNYLRELHRMGLIVIE